MKVFCAEATWDKNIKNGRSTYESLLELIKNETNCELAYFTFNTEEELYYLFDLFKKNKYDIFYLSSHMGQGDITSGEAQQIRINIYNLLELNAHNIKNKVLHLAGCSSLRPDNFDINFVKGLCRPRIISGYTKDTDTTESSAMDLLYIVALIREGPKRLYNKLNGRYEDLVKASGFELHDFKEI